MRTGCFHQRERSRKQEPASLGGKEGVSASRVELIVTRAVNLIQSLVVAMAGKETKRQEMLIS